MKIVKWIRDGHGGLSSCVDAAELISAAGDALDSAYASDIMGEILFLGDDGEYYVGCVEFVILQANPAYVKDCLEEDEDS